MSEEEERDRYLKAAHAMQSGVAAMMAINPNGATSPKHLRVGVNSAMTEQRALATLLIERGLFTAEEYAKAMADAMEAEVGTYEAELSKFYERPVTLA